jgi:CelD/BcsL family acetyltransferase involved in cellulose biosynthesis
LGTEEVVTDRFAAFRREVATRLADQGHLLLALLRLDGKVVAGELCFPFHTTCYRYNCCYDPAWKDESVGTVLQWETMQAAIAAGCREYDFLRGDEPYKYQWGAQPRRQVKIRVSRVSPKLRLLEIGARLARARQHASTEWRRANVSRFQRSPVE